MKTIARIVLCVFIISFSLTSSRAQTEKYHFEAGINLGTLLYQGDLVESPLGSFKGVRRMVNLWIAKPFTPYFSWRANFTVGSLSADESRFATPSWKQTRNFAFNTPVTELSGMLQFNLNGDNGKGSYHALTPYLVAGAGIGLFRINRDWSRMDTTAFNSKSASNRFSYRHTTYTTANLAGHTCWWRSPMDGYPSNSYQCGGCGAF